VYAVASLDAVTTKYAANGKNVTIVGMNDDSAARHGRLAGTSAPARDHPPAAEQSRPIIKLARMMRSPS
jgi:hypothetical protein